MKYARQMILILLLSLLVLSLSNILKIKQNNYPSTYDEYYHIQEISKLRFFSDLSLLKDQVVYPLDFLLSFSEDPALYMKLLPFLFGILNIFLIHLILRKLVSNEKQMLFSCLFIVFSPVYIFIHTTYNDIFAPFTFILFGTLLLLYDNYFLSLLFFLSGFAFNPRFFIIIFLILIVFYEKTKTKNIILPIIGLVATTYLFISINKASLLGEITFHSLLTTYISDFGATAGFGIFSLILGFIGILMSWKDKKSNAIFYFSLIALLFALLYDTRMMIFLELFFAYYSGKAFINILETEWESQTLKNYFILLIFCGIIFSFGSFVTRFPKEGPQRSEIISLEWLRNSDIENRKVLSHYEYGFMISALSKKEAYADKNYYLSSIDKTKIKKSEELFQLRNLKNITSSLDKENIGYFWINTKMKEGQVWEKDEQGILFVLKHSSYFQKIYDYEGTEIWKYLKKA
jgi:hypothetical protein